jgi:hypothetical protein
MDMCLNVRVVDPVVTQLVTQQPRRGRLMKLRDLVVLRRQRRFGTESWDVSSRSRLAMPFITPTK